MNQGKLLLLYQHCKIHAFDKESGFLELLLCFNGRQLLIVSLSAIFNSCKYQ